jgi:AcrR family transcriptional regulator
VTQPKKAPRPTGKNPAKSPVPRVRRTPEEARTLALTSARRLLLAEGPDAITLQAVAGDLGMSHTNLIHHFGSASGLQSELMRQMVSELTTTIESAVMRLRAGKAELKDFVDIVFDAFEVVRDYIDSVERATDDEGGAAAIHERVTSATLFVTVAALGDAIIGNELRKMVGRERETVRKLMGTLLPAVLAPQPKGGGHS